MDNDRLEITPQCAFEHVHAAENCEMAAMNLLANRRAIEYAITRREAVLRNTINLEEVDGKKKYSNADARTAEFGKRSTDDKDLLDLRSKLSEVVAEIGAAEIEAKFHARIVRIICSFADTYRATPNTEDDEVPWKEGI